MRQPQLKFWIPELPSSKFSPNQLSRSWKERAPIIREIKRNFSMLLEETLPFIDRPIIPFDFYNVEICFHLLPGATKDPTNYYGRMKPWEDVLKEEGIIKDDSFKCIKSITLTRKWAKKKSETGLWWTITDATPKTYDDLSPGELNNIDP